MSRIVEAGYCRLDRPLQTPYRLSFTSLATFDSVLAYVASDDDRIGFGEAVALPGYSWEVTGDIVETVRHTLPSALKIRLDEFSEACSALFPRRPFAASALQSCIDTLLQPPEISPDFALSINYPISSESSDSALADTLSEAVQRGYDYIKVKVGRDIQRDIQALDTLLNHPQAKRLRFSFDANQAFSPHDARGFCAALEGYDSGNVLWLEQPFDKNAWTSIESLAQSVSIPILLDESIYDSNDVRRAADVGATGIKLKAFKNLGPAGCTELAALAETYGLGVVIGNGVATEVGNYLELAAVSHSPTLFRAPVECNGFSKTKEPLCRFPVLSEGKGQVRLAGPDVSPRRLGKCIRDTVRARGEIFRLAPASN